MRYALLIIGMFMIACSASTGDEWETHVNSNNVTSIWADTGLVYWGSTAGVVIRDPSTGVGSKVLKSAGGLGSNKITAIARDDDGSLWIGTADAGVQVLHSNGVWEWHSTRNLRLLSDEVNDISTDGTLAAVATSGGVSLFESGEFKTFFDGSEWGQSECSDVLAVASDDDELLVGTDCGVFSYSFQDRLWSGVLAERSAHSIDHDDISLFWIVTQDSIYTYDGTDLAIITRQGIRTDVLYDVGAMDTTVWMAASRGPSRYDFPSQSWQRNTTGLPDKIKDASSVFVGGDDLVWLGTEDGGAVLSKGSWVMHLSDGPAGNYAQDIEVDMNGTVWCTTGSRGGAGPGQMIGLLKYDGFSWELIVNPPLANKNPFAIDTHPVDGSLWVGFWVGGLMRHDIFTGEWESYNHLLQSGVIAALHIESDGVIYLAEYLKGLGVVCTDGTDIHYTKEDLPTCVETLCLTAIGAGPNGVMMGSYVSPVEGCLAKVVQLDIGEECTDKADDACEIWGEAANWIGGNAYTAATDIYGVGWLGTAGGLSSYDGEWHGVNGKIGVVWDIEVDANGTKWVGTDLGLYVLEGYGTEWDHFSGRVRIYDSSNSPLPDSPVKALAFDADGALWIGTGGGGIYRFESRVERPKKQWVEVFPNPYYAWKDTEGKGIRFAGFLPGQKIRIYTVAGDLVAQVDNDLPWFTKNMSGEDVVPGVYIYHAYAEDGSEFMGRLVIVR
jgi:ligand-binding sensor domain-containing protein